MSRTEGLKGEMLASSTDTHRPLGRVPVRGSWRRAACLIFCPETAVTQQCVAPQSGVSHLSGMLIAGQSDSLSRAHHDGTERDRQRRLTANGDL